jgi:mono/diheme cytochrome c family protein
MGRVILAVAALALVASSALADSPGGRPAKSKYASGGDIYKNICAACHMANAKGNGAGAVPALAGNKKLANPAYPITVVMKGKGAMPWFSEMLTPAEVASVLTYVRTNFGNAYSAPVTEVDVNRVAKPSRSME